MMFFFLAVIVYAAALSLLYYLDWRSQKLEAAHKNLVEVLVPASTDEELHQELDLVCQQRDSLAEDLGTVANQCDVLQEETRALKWRIETLQSAVTLMRESRQESAEYAAALYLALIKSVPMLNKYAPETIGALMLRIPDAVRVAIERNKTPANDDVPKGQEQAS